MKHETLSMFESLEPRQLMSALNVAVRAGDAIATEGGSDGATLIVSRNKALPTKTRVYFSIGGTARGPQTTPAASIDYDVFAMTVPQPSSSPGPVLQTRMGSTPYVDIAPGRTTTTVVLAARDDAEVEMTETATFTIVPGGAYTVSNVNSATLYIVSNDHPDLYRINFQPTGMSVPSGYTADTGRLFSEQAPGMTYGWNIDSTANAVARNNPFSPDARYDSFINMHAGGGGVRRWEIALPQGTYMVRVVAGDPNDTGSNYGMTLEGQNVTGGRANAERQFFRTTTVLEVTDGRLTLGSSLATSLNPIQNKVQFIEIKRLPRRSKLGPIATVSAPLKTPETAGWWHQQPNGLFSDTQMDEALWA